MPGHIPRASPQGPPPPAAPPRSPGHATWGGQGAASSYPSQPGPLTLCIPGSHPTSHGLIHPSSRIPSLTLRGPAGSSILWKPSICPSVPFVGNSHSLASTLKWSALLLVGICVLTLLMNLRGVSLFFPNSKMFSKQDGATHSLCFLCMSQPIKRTEMSCHDPNKRLYSHFRFFQIFASLSRSNQIPKEPVKPSVLFEECLGRESLPL